MVVETVNENLCINKLITSKKEIIMVEGDMIVPDSKPDVLNTICTSGVVCVYKKEILDGKIRIDGNINTYIMYMADNEQDKIRGLSTSLDFSESIQVPGINEEMECQLETKVKSMESKVINGRKIGIKATLEVSYNIYLKEDISIVSDIQNSGDMQMLRDDANVNSLVGSGSTKIYAKDTISVNNVDNIAEILKVDINICDKDVKVSYNKILTKAEAQVKILYLTEDNRINSVSTKIPIVGFIDIQNVNENNICDMNYEIKNMLLKLNAIEEHSMYVEIEVEISASVYEERQITFIQDLYSPSESLEYNKKQITTMVAKRNTSGMVQIREKVEVEGLDNRNILDVEVIPIIENESKFSNKIMYEGSMELRFIISGNDMQVDTRTTKIPFEYTMDGIEDGENVNTRTDMEIINQDFIIQEGNLVTSNIDAKMDLQTYKTANMNVMNEIQINGEREEEDYSILMYIVKKDDTLWNIAKEFGSTVDDIVRANGIEDENLIQPGQKLFIPKYVKTGSVSSYV